MLQHHIVHILHLNQHTTHFPFQAGKYSREQHGVSEGHLLVRPQVAWAYATDAVANAAKSVDVRTIMYGDWG